MPSSHPAPDRLTPEREAERVQGLLYEAITAFQSVAHLSSLQHAQMRGYLAEHALNMRGALSPNGQARKVPFPLGETLTPAVEWLISRVAELEARLAELQRPGVEAKRNEIRESLTALAARAEQDRDYEGAFDVRCRLREREEQWKREDEEATR